MEDTVNMHKAGIHTEGEAPGYPLILVICMYINKLIIAAWCIG